MLPGELNIMSNDSLIFSFYDGQTFLAQKIGSEWKIEPFENPMGGDIIDALINPLRTLQTGNWGDLRDIKDERLIFSEKSPSGWLQKEIKTGQLIITKHICGLNGLQRISTPKG